MEYLIAAEHVTAIYRELYRSDTEYDITTEHVTWHTGLSGVNE